MERHFVVVPATARLAVVARVRDRPGGPYQPAPSRRTDARSSSAVAAAVAVPRWAPVAVFVMATVVVPVAVVVVRCDRRAIAVVPVAASALTGGGASIRDGAEKTCGARASREPRTAEARARISLRPSTRPALPEILRQNGMTDRGERAVRMSVAQPSKRRSASQRRWWMASPSIARLHIARRKKKCTSQSQVKP